MYKHLISPQRSQIFAYRQCGKDAKFIANALCVHISTIYRELSRNRNKRGGYACNAHEMAMERQERVIRNASISKKVKFRCLQHIRVDQWSPEGISGVLLKEGIRVSHTTIYKRVKEDKTAGGSLYGISGTRDTAGKGIHIRPHQRAISPTGYLLRTGPQKPMVNGSVTGRWTL